MIRSKKWLKCGRGSWHDPGQLILKVMMALLYMVGLMGFQRFTGLLPKPETNQVTLSRNTRSLLSIETNETLSYNMTSNETDIINEEVEQDPLFPKDLFTMKQIRDGAVSLYMIGVVYMFVALAIVCDEFFVPSLDVIIEKIGCSEDVAGATFMAAGGSAPELFTSAIGVFIAFSNVGIGTIVGSAVFNILFVIGMCALFSKTVLLLTWWPLLRDCSFYSISLISLILFFMDELIEWWEALIMLSIYGSYVYFMKYNVQAEKSFKKCIGAKNKVQQSPLINNGGRQGYTGVPVLHAGSMYHGGLLQLMIHTIDPLNDAVDQKAAQLYNIAAFQQSLQGASMANGFNGSNYQRNVTAGIEGSQFDEHFNEDQLSRIGVDYVSEGKNGKHQNGNGQTNGDNKNSNDFPLVDDDTAPLDLSWPDTWAKRIAYVLTLPLVLPMWLTLPDTRKTTSRKYFIITFVGSILWIAAFSYLMVWWATITGNAFSIPPEVMGLTFLAAGTSIPDLFTSVIVARKGFGDMAVSSSVGSNIFDVTVGLPLPWLLYSLAFGVPVPVSSTGMLCSICLLFLMLIMVFLSILLFNWKMTRGMGFSMFVLYFLFVLITLGFEYHLYECPM